MAKKKITNEDLFREYAKTRSLELRDELVVKYLYIAEILTKKYINRGLEYDDLYQVASLALIYAVERFDVEKGYEFSSFATPTIIGEIKKYFRDKGWMIRVPRRLQELAKKVNEAKEHLHQELKRPVKVSDIAAYLEVKESEVFEAMEASLVYTPKSLDVSYSGDDSDQEIFLSSLIGEEDKEFKELEDRDFIERCLEKLDKVEAKIISSRFLEGRTQVQVADELGVSQMTVSRMEKKLIAKFREDYYKICK
ncbi:MAG: SigB/SigF/SigG family RNA polymerase sigma factor [Bacillota bacterium]|nr:SigB/SigF/SigG family RNA polymerase sigma factor [Bacillota bacterium]